MRSEITNYDSRKNDPYIGFKVKLLNRYICIFRDVIENIFRDSPNKETFKILDFGCGEGRFLPLLIDLCKRKSRKIKLHITAYDISGAMLESLISNLRARGYLYKELENEWKKEVKYGYQTTTLYQENVTIHVIMAPPSCSVGRLKGLLGKKYDISICMYGSLSHIPQRINRQNFIKLLNEVTAFSGRVIISVPGKSRFQEEQKIYKSKWKKIPLSQLFNFISEPGDIFYNNPDGTKNYYHIYESCEFLYDLESCGLKPIDGVQANNILSEKKLIQYSCIDKVDSFFAFYVPFSLLNTLSSYHVAICTISSRFDDNYENLGKFNRARL